MSSNDIDYFDEGFSDNETQFTLEMEKNIKLKQKNKKEISDNMNMNNGKVWEYKSGDVDKLAEQVLENGKEFVYTKPEMAKDLINTITFKDGDVVMEPCKGNGAFYNQLPNNVVKLYCELQEGINYLLDEREVDITISNPPFVPRKLFWEFHKRAMKNTRREIYWLINFQSFNVFTTKRLNEINTAMTIKEFLSLSIKSKKPKSGITLGFKE